MSEYISMTNTNKAQNSCPHPLENSLDCYNKTHHMTVFCAQTEKLITIRF